MVSSHNDSRVNITINRVFKTLSFTELSKLLAYAKAHAMGQQLLKQYQNEPDEGLDDDSDVTDATYAADSAEFLEAAISMYPLINVKIQACEHAHLV